MKSLAIKFFLITVSLGLAVLLGEISLRLAGLEGLKKIAQP